MAMKEQQRSVYRTARGRELDMNKLVNQNELTIAVGNAKVNARGDKLGPNGQIIQRREDIQRANDTVAIPDQISVREVQPEIKSVVEKSKSTTPVKTVKNIADMDPEGKE
jgi:hypothetical protein